MQRDLFFIKVRPLFGGSLQQHQVDGLTLMLDYAERHATPIFHLAYILATAFHETAATMQPVRETLASSDDQAIAVLDRSFAKGQLGNVNTPYWRKDRSGKSWLGRGYVQLTHERNYRKLSGVTGVDLVADPAKAMVPETAVVILFVGMELGAFTGQSLGDFISPDGSWKNYKAARAIVNGKDRAMTIADYASKFEAALFAALYRAVIIPPGADAPAPPLSPMPPKSGDQGGAGNAAGPSAAPAKVSGWSILVSAIAKLLGVKQ
jgi:hypothetical protein